MSSFLTEYKGYNSNRLHSQNIWADCPIEEIRAGTADGVYFFDDFDRLVPTGTITTQAAWKDYRAFGSSGGTITDAAIQGGGILLTEATADEGVAIATGTFVNMLPRGLSVTGLSAGKLWFEARIKVSNLTDAKSDVFVGLMDSTALTATVPFTAAGSTLADVNIVGFHRLAGDGDMLDTTYKANGVTAVTLQADAITLTADTFVKCGMVWDPATNILTFYNNGTKLSTTYTMSTAAGTAFPNDILLGPCFAVLLDNGTSPGLPTIDWWACAQVW